ARFLEHLERNRWWLLLAYHKRRTLLLLLPALLVTELAVALFALRHGQLSAKMRAWRSLLSRPMRADLRAKRAAVQRARVVTDRAFLQRHTAKLGMPLSSSALVRRIVNPLLA